MSLFLVMAGGAVGSGARYLLGRALSALSGSGFPYGTLAANLLGGLLMGALAASLSRGGAGEPWRLFAGVGVLGGFTTFSAFSLDAVTLFQGGAPAAAGGYVLLSVAGSVAAVLLGARLAGSWA